MATDEVAKGKLLKEEAIVAYQYTGPLFQASNASETIVLRKYCHECWIVIIHQDVLSTLHAIVIGALLFINNSLFSTFVHSKLRCAGNVLRLAEQTVLNLKQASVCHSST